MTKHLMHAGSGEVDTLENWRKEFESVSLEDWFGLPAECCEGLHWIDHNIDHRCGKPFLVEVVKNKSGHWVTAQQTHP